MKKILLSSFVILAMLLFAGCVAPKFAEGPQFIGFENSNDKEAVLYVYRENSFFGSGVSYTVNVEDNNMTSEPIGHLKSGGYLVKRILANQDITVWAKTEARKDVDISLKPNTIHCIKASVGWGILVGRPQFEIVNFKTCKREIFDTKLSIDDADTK